jgi:hypothetical protein
MCPPMPFDRAWRTILAAALSVRPTAWGLRSASPAHRSAAAAAPADSPQSVEEPISAASIYFPDLRRILREGREPLPERGKHGKADPVPRVVLGKERRLLDAGDSLAKFLPVDPRVVRRLQFHLPDQALADEEKGFEGRDKIPAVRVPADDVVDDPFDAGRVAGSFFFARFTPAANADAFKLTPFIRTAQAL